MLLHNYPGVHTHLQRSRVMLPSRPTVNSRVAEDTRDRSRCTNSGLPVDMGALRGEVSPEPAPSPPDGAPALPLPVSTVLPAADGRPLAGADGTSTALPFTVTWPNAADAARN